VPLGGRVTGSPGHHNLYQYDADSALVDHVVPFLTEGVAEHEAVVLVVDPRKRALIEEALGAAATRIDYVDRDTYYTRPEDALAGYDARVRRYLRGEAHRIRVFGELPLCRTREESDTWIRYEALLNPAFAHHPVTIVCGLDAREQPDSVLEGSWETHPRTMNHGWSENGHYHHPKVVVRARTPPSEDVTGLRAVSADINARALRLLLLAEMAAAEIPAGGAEQMIVAAGEVLANAHRYGGGVRALRIGRVGERFVCEISDHGPGLDDPVAGYVPPGSDVARGAGLWVARQMTRRLDMLSSDRGLTTRLWV
jgi:anti-sigma regulatory factor (Ser/Thr protein kinase)